jgi:hypothetical protein
MLDPQVSNGDFLNANGLVAPDFHSNWLRPQTINREPVYENKRLIIDLPVTMPSLDQEERDHIKVRDLKRQETIHKAIRTDEIIRNCTYNGRHATDW